MSGENSKRSGFYPLEWAFAKILIFLNLFYYIIRKKEWW